MTFWRPFLVFRTLSQDFIDGWFWDPTLACNDASLADRRCVCVWLGGAIATRLEGWSEDSYCLGY